jgi:hypothetical protein
MTFVPFPWKRKSESLATPLNPQTLNAEEEALAAQVTSGAIPLPASVVSGSTVAGAAAGQIPIFAGSEPQYPGAPTGAAPHNTTFYDVTASPFNAVANGGAHALSTRFSTLAEAQVVYPFATALTQQIDWAALQLAVNTASAAGGGVIWLPAGRPLVLQQQVTWASHVYLQGAAASRTDTEGTAAGSVITNSSTGTFIGTTFTAKTNTSTSLTEISSFASIFPNAPIKGTGIPVGTHIVSVNEGAKTAVLSQAATASEAGVTITPGLAMINTAGCLRYGFQRISFNYVNYPVANVAMAISDFSGQGAVLEGNASIVGCYFNNFGGTANIGLNGNVNYISENSFDLPVGHLIFLPNSGQPGKDNGTDGFVAYNQAGFTLNSGSAGTSGTGCVGSGIVLENGGYYLVLANDIYNCSHAGVNNDCPSNRWVGNRFEKTDRAGLVFEGTNCYNSTAVGNIIFNCGYAKGKEAAISVLAAAERITLSANVILNDVAASGGELWATMNKTTTLTAVNNTFGTTSAEFSNLRVGALVYSHLNLPEGTYVVSINEGAKEAVLSQAALVTGANIEIHVLPTFVGIALSGTAEHCNITGNLVYNMCERAFTMNESAYNLFASNLVHTTGLQAFDGEKLNNTMVDGLLIYNPNQSNTASTDAVFVNIGKRNNFHNVRVWGGTKARAGVRFNGAETEKCSVRGGGCTEFATAAYQDTGTSNTVRDFEGYVVGAITITLETTKAITATAYDRTFYLTAGAGEVKIAIASGPTIVIPEKTSSTIFLQAGRTFTPTFAVALTQALVDGWAG